MSPVSQQQLLDLAAADLPSPTVTLKPKREPTVTLRPRTAAAVV